MAQNRFKWRKEAAKNAFLQGQSTQDVELVAEPVAELAEHRRTSSHEVVVVTTFCYGLIDAPRRW